MIDSKDLRLLNTTRVSIEKLEKGMIIHNKVSITFSDPDDPFGFDTIRDIEAWKIRKIIPGRLKGYDLDIVHIENVSNPKIRYYNNRYSIAGDFVTIVPSKDQVCINSVVR